MRSFGNIGIFFNFAGLHLIPVFSDLAILKDADLESTSSKKVRLQLEDILNCDLLSRKKEIDELVLSCINPEGDDDEESEAASDADSDYSEEEKPKKKRASTGKAAAPAKKKKYDSTDEDSAGSDSGSDYKPTGYTPKAKGKKKGKKGSEDDSDDDYKAPKKAKAKKVGLMELQSRL